MRRYRVLLARYENFATLLLMMVLALSGCTPKIGDSCTQSTDCSPQGTRACDTSQLGGYCTVFGCVINSCPDRASCVVFHVSVPGCPYNDYDAPARTGRSLCMAGCKQDSDCRGGYVCRDPRGPPWSAAILDDTQQNVCIEAPTAADEEAGMAPTAAVCLATARGTDASSSSMEPADSSNVTFIDAGVAADSANEGAPGPADAPGGG